MNDREFLEKRLDLFEGDAWSMFVEELNTMANSLDSIMTIEDEKGLYFNKGQVGILNMVINLEETTKAALDQLDD
jgi:hypothetical protein|tara:strand:+ start:314 stop:538 length:225 start_codon:yes stop_codon:yes gene_type:complete